MTESLVKKLFRRCATLASVIVVTGCANLSHQGVTNVVIQDKSYRSSQAVVVPVVTPAFKSESELPQPIEVLDKNFALEIPRQEDLALVSNITTRFKLPVPVIADIVSLAAKYAFEDFPKKHDILAIIAVESSYKAKALLQGCYGLMQVQKKSHLNKIQGRSLYLATVNIEIGASILRQYYLLLNKDKRAAILAYNAGIGNYLKKRYKMQYYTKYRNQLALLSQ
jgi:hypothetical protein